MKPPPPQGKLPVPNRGFRLFIHHSAIVALGLAVVTLLVYWPVVRHDFINLDDQVYVTECPQVLGGLTANNIRWAFQTTEGGAWHPLTWLTLMCDAEWSGRQPWGYHFTNLVLHVLNTLLVFGWLRRATGTLWQSAIVAAMFALHPLHVESVAWVAERKDILSTLFGLGALWAYSNYASVPAKTRKADPSIRPKLWYGIALVTFLFSLLSKPMLVTMPFICLLLDFWPFKRLSSWRWVDLRPLLMEKIPFLLLAIAASAVTIVAQRSSEAVASLAWLSVGQRITNALVSYVRYLGKTFWPGDLAIFYPHPGHWSVLAVIGAAALLVGISALAFKLRNRQPFLVVGWLWFLGTLVPVIGLVQVGAQAMADRYTYVPLIGLFIAFVWGLWAVLSTSRLKASRPLGIALATGGVVVGLACLTRVQLGHWQDSEQLFRHALQVTRNNEVAHVNLASALLDQKRFAEAETECRHALEINSASVEALGNLGLALAGQARWPDAVMVYEEALRLNPQSYRALNGLGLALANQGKLPEATAAFRRALATRPRAVEVLNNLGLTLAMQNQTAEAKQQYANALQINPNEVQTLNNLGLLLAKENNWSEAEACYRRALEANPKSVDSLVNWGAALAAQGNLDQAAQRYLSALQIAPENAVILYNLGVLRARQGSNAEAVHLLTRAQQLQPGQPAITELIRKLQDEGGR